jgi:hypothetical protein
MTYAAFAPEATSSNFALKKHVVDTVRIVVKGRLFSKTSGQSARASSSP